MPSIVTSATAIADVNKALEAVLKTYLDSESSGTIDIRFDLPEINSTQSTPTVSVFLYDVHEDLQMRQSEPARLNVTSSALRAGWVNLSCSYLITYWEAQSVGSDGSGPDSGPDSQAVNIITRTLQALLNNRELSGIAGAYSRIIPPQENLSSLGSFWQALGNRPRLSLMYSVTLPILLDNSLPQTLVKTVSSEIVQTANVDIKALNALLWQTLCEQVGAGAEQKLARVRLTSEPQTTEDSDVATLKVNLVLSGLVDKSNKTDLDTILKAWGKSDEAVAEINGAGIYITEMNSAGLQYL